MTIQTKTTDLDFSELHQHIQGYVDRNIIPFANTLVMQGDQIVDLHYYGAPGNATQQSVAEDTIFRMHSSTKIACSLGAMLLWEEGRFSLDDPLEKFIPAFTDMQVLKPDAKTLEDSRPAEGPIRIRHILSHTAGLSYGFIEPESVIDQAYNQAGINPLMPGSSLTLESLCEGLGQLPLCFEPGSFWRYSFATDVTARLIEVISGQRFDEFLQARLFKPLGMIDTDFFVPEEKLGRFSTLYLPADPLDPMSECAGPMDAPETTSNGSRPTFLSGGGGLMSTLVDYLALSRMIVNNGSHNGQTIIKPETLAQMRTNQCAEGVVVNFPMWSMPGTTFGLGFALKGQPAEGEPDSAAGEFHWGGMAGTHFWWSPKANISGICMTQRMPGFWHPFSHDFKRLAYKIAS